MLRFCHEKCMLKCCFYMFIVSFRLFSYLLKNPTKIPLLVFEAAFKMNIFIVCENAYCIQSKKEIMSVHCVCV